MFNQIRAEFYKLFHTKALYLTFALILAVFGIFSIGGQQQFVASSSSLDETWKIGETVGFLARAYSDTAHPLIEVNNKDSHILYCIFLADCSYIFCHFLFKRIYGFQQLKLQSQADKAELSFLLRNIL